jgi:4-hydroxybenzoate polyprenyl transferase
MIPLFRNTCSLFLRSNILRISTISIHSVNQKLSVYDLIPKSIHPYVRSSRVDKPIGSWVIYLPSAWSIALAGTTVGNIALLGLFGAGALLMRGAGCTINDILDKDYDCHVERTKSRPIASGEISIRQGMVWAGVQLSLAFLILIQLNLPTICIGVLSLIPVVIYPIMKRHTYWPQFFLGATLNWFVNKFLFIRNHNLLTKIGVYLWVLQQQPVLFLHL